MSCDKSLNQGCAVETGGDRFEGTFRGRMEWDLETNGMRIEEEGGVGRLCDDFDLVAWEDGSAFTEAGSPGGEAKVKSREQDM